MSKGFEENEGVRLDGADRWLAGLSRRVGEPPLIDGRWDSSVDLSAAFESPRIRVTIHCEGFGADEIAVWANKWLKGEIKLRSFEIECGQGSEANRVRASTAK